MLTLLCALGGAAAQGEGGFRLSPGLEQAVRAGQIVPMEAPVDAELPFAAFTLEGKTYGATERLFQKRMTLGDASLWTRAGLDMPAADWTWADFMALADAVRAYRMTSGETVYLLWEETETPLLVDALMDGVQADAAEAEGMLEDYKRLWEEGLIGRVGDTQERPGRDAAFLRTEELGFLLFLQSRVVSAPQAWEAPVPIVARMTVREAGAAQPELSEPDPCMSGVMATDTPIEAVRAAWTMESQSPPTQAQLELWLDGLERGVLYQNDEARRQKQTAFADFLDGKQTATECVRALSVRE